VGDVGTALLNLNFGVEWGSAFSFTPLVVKPKGKNPRYRLHRALSRTLILFGSFEEEKNIFFPLRIKPCCFGHTACRLVLVIQPVDWFWSYSLSTGSGHTAYRLVLVIQPVDWFWSYSLSTGSGHTACRLVSIKTTLPEFWMCAGNAEKTDQGN